MTKREIREEMRRMKRAATAAQLEQWSAALVTLVLNNPQVRSARTVLLYHPLPDEADIRPLLTALQPKRLLLPVVVADDLELRIFEGATSLRPGAFGILEPTGPVFRELEQIDIAIVPGMAFTPDGCRLGRGRGYYDRLLPRLTHAYRIGVCWPFQLLDELSVEPHDIRMHTVLSAC